ncbi:hypothetical protein A1O3_08278 [Capronia epimyces CBS 606.96]|uniref:Myb-like DNA-binding domain-containing protein n=1 Tax=Capronia epimyces CBS 606.96 TaxID=1182542 RepID=W9XHK2_9EURO|nr:uncharacterized protein A1O3_08278 [Capronia epimyces CBS 606.96]EXJ79992.1 hypothetical protein A1O3_08278 [Capronia epimyces CBS 606.96]
MPSKASVGSASGEADPAFKFVFSVLKHCESIKPNWEEVAKENGIGYARNASSKFKDIVKKHGLEFKGNTICDPADGGAEGAADEAKTPKKAKAATPRKRKSEDDSDMTPNSTGKQKKSAPFMAIEVKSEDDKEAALKQVKPEDTESKY